MQELVLGQDETARRGGARSSSPQAGARQRRGRPGEPRLTPYLYLAPGFLIFALFVLVPLGHTVWLSLFQWDGVSTGTWVGLENYRSEFADPALRQALTHSLVFVVTFCLIPVSLGLVLAAVLSRRKIHGLAVFRTILFLPQVIAMVVVGVAWRWMYADGGTVNQVLRFFGIPANTAWLGDFT